MESKTRGLWQKKKTSVGCIMHIKVIHKVSRIGGSNLIFGQNRK